MNISALRAAGLTDADIVKVIEVVQADEAKRLEVRREQARVRMINSRSRKRMINKGSRYAGYASRASQGEMWEPVEDATTKLEPVEDATTKLFRIGTVALMSWGLREDKARSMLGRWLKAKDDAEELLALIEHARAKNVIEPISYISSMVTGHSNGKRTAAEAARSLADKIRARESEAGLQ